MEFIIILILGVFGAALIAGGCVIYRGSTRSSIRALGASAIAAGVVMWAFIILITPLRSVAG